MVSDTVKDTAKQAIAALKKAGVKKTVMLTGDAAPVAKAVAEELGIDEYHSELLPGDKVGKEAADVVLMDDNPRIIAKAIRISRKWLRIVKQNIWFAIGVKVICLILGAVGLGNMWLAILADVGVMILAVLNAIRALFVKNL